MTTQQKLTPSAKGSLQRTPYSNLLVYCLDRRLTGTMVMEAPDQKRHAIFFEDGHPAKVRTADPVAYLGDLLVEQGMIQVDGVDASLERARAEGALLGQVLVNSGDIGDDALEQALREQVSRRVTHLATLPEQTLFAFYAKKNLLARWGGSQGYQVDGLSAIWGGLVASNGDSRMAATLKKLGTVPLRLHADGDFRRFGIIQKVSGIVDLMRARPMPLAKLERAGVGDPQQVRLLIYAFAITRHLDFGDRSALPVGVRRRKRGVTFSSKDAAAAIEKARARMAAQSRAKTMPSDEAAKVVAATEEEAPMSQELRDRREQILDRSMSIDKEDFFSMLGVEQEAPNSAIQAAYFELAKQWHPDKLPPQLGDVRQAASKVFARLSEAFQTLTDTNKRGQYMNMLKEGGATPEEQEKIALIVDASMDFQKAEVFLKRGDIRGAFKMAERAYTKNPEQSDHLSLLTWLQINQPDASAKEVRKAVDTFSQLLADEPDHQRSLWYRGSAYKRLEQNAKAAKDFRALLELNPRHVDAAREVRLFEMRKGKLKDKSDQPTAGEQLNDIFGKLFKR